jgi:HPt (histidine-containing phosphotransfer) domain-containing protein
MIIDIKKIIDLYQMDRKTILKVLNIFLTSTDEDCKALGSALNEKKLDEVNRFSHKLKASYSYLMCQESVTLCNEIRDEAKRTNNIVTVEPLVSKIFEIHKELIKEIHTYLEVPES